MEEGELGADAWGERWTGGINASRSCWEVERERGGVGVGGVCGRRKAPVGAKRVANSLYCWFGACR